MRLASHYLTIIGNIESLLYSISLETALDGPRLCTHMARNEQPLREHAISLGMVASHEHVISLGMNSLSIGINTLSVGINTLSA